MNAVSKEPAVKRMQVFVIKSANSVASNGGAAGGNRNRGSSRRRPSTSTSTRPISPSITPYLPPSTSTSKRPTDPREFNPSIEVDGASGGSTGSAGNREFTERKPGWFQAQPCPISSYCLNGGTCSLYETVGEYVCQ